jgi:menaquinol-cytochrome c reductase cytochrome b/c subunit
VNAQEKERYLREYYILKNQGKPFFPYAILKDSLMAVIVLVVIIVMALVLGAEIGPKADPTSTTYTPRPEWYFFFLFELLRVVKPPALVFIATIGIPTICMVLLILLPFIDRNPERHPLKRPVATIAGITTMAAMAFLTIEGALAGPPTQIEEKVPAKYQKGKAVTASSGCLGCHRIGHNGNAGPGPDLTHVGSELSREAISRTLVNPTAPMPSYSALRERNPEQFEELVNYLGHLR